MTEYIDVSIDVFMNAEEKAKVRADVTVQELMNIIVTEFN